MLAELPRSRPLRPAGMRPASTAAPGFARAHWARTQLAFLRIKANFK